MTRPVRSELLANADLLKRSEANKGAVIELHSFFFSNRRDLGA